MSSPTSPQVSQAGLAYAATVALEPVWAELDITNLTDSLPTFALNVAAVTRRYGLMSSGLAVRQYGRARTAAGVSNTFRIQPAPPSPLDQVKQSIDWAMQPLWSQQPDLATAKTNVNGVAEKLVLDSGRRTILDNVHRDKKAHGWARLTEAEPCAFCALLAIRGAVYRSDTTADFRAHDHCRCHCEPLFAPYEPSPQIQGWQQLYRDSTTSGNSARTRREWRRAFDAHQAQP